MVVYFNNDFNHLNDVKLSALDRGFLFADGVYESIRTYNKKLFRYEEHLARLKRSLNEIRIDFKELNSLENIIYELIKKNHIEGETLVYLQITRGTTLQRTHSFPKEKITPTLFVSVKEFKEDNEEQLKGVKVILQEDVRWLRCDIKSISLINSLSRNTLNDSSNLSKRSSICSSNKAVKSNFEASEIHKGLIFCLNQILFCSGNKQYSTNCF